MAYDLYYLLPSLKPCKLVDTSNTRCLNKIHVPLVNPLKTRYISNYTTRNDLTNQWKFLPPISYKYDTLHFPNESFLRFPSLSELYKGTDTHLPHSYCNKYCKFSEVLQCLLQNFKSIAILIAKSQSITIFSNTIETIPASTVRIQEWWQQRRCVWCSDVVWPQT